MDKAQLACRLAESVIKRSVDYLSSHEDSADVLKHRANDITRRIDIVAEEALDKAIITEGIVARVVSEELGERIVPAGRKPEYTLVLDPIDGSNNAVSGIPYFCSSLALSTRTEGATFADIDAAAVASIANGTYTVQRGGGARWNGKPINVSWHEEKPRYAIYSYNAGHIPDGLVTLQEGRCIVRTLGSIALDLCLLSRGSLDAVIDTRRKLSGYDILAGALILEEAGGIITDDHGYELSGLPVTATGISIVAAANKAIQESILKRITV